MRIIQSPGKYIQGPDALSRLPIYIKDLSTDWLMLIDEAMDEVAHAMIGDIGQDLRIYSVRFNGECCQEEITSVMTELQKNSCTGIIALGGGKVLDTAKAVAFECQVPSVMVPTVASTDAPTSALSVIYTKDGMFSEYRFYPSNPDMVIVDTTIIAHAPARLLVSGMGDALSTWFEAKACYDAGASNMAGAQSTQASLTLARLCYDTLLSEGIKAKMAVEQKVTSRALERVVEANTYLSGIGFESSGLAAAHAIHNGLTILPECHHLYHGEKVAFGTLTQLVLQNSPLAQINEVIDFCLSVGLPVTLNELNIITDVQVKMRDVASVSCAEGETIYNMPFSVDVNSVYSALLIADQLGCQRKAENRNPSITHL